MREQENLYTKRLVLREFREEDFTGVHAYASKLSNIKYMIWGPNTEADTINFLKEVKETNARLPRLHYDFAITLKDVDNPGQLIGGCGIYLSDNRKTGMLGWILHSDYWKQGYTAEAGYALLDYGFKTLGLHRIYATCNAENYGSYRVMEKLKMRREAHFISARYGRVGEREQWYDEYQYGILDTEFLRGNQGEESI